MDGFHGPSCRAAIFASLFELTNTYFLPIPNFVSYFGLGNPINPIVLTATERQRLADGETFWVYGFVTYESFADEVFELGFVCRAKASLESQIRHTAIAASAIHSRPR
jgi:hypothetical protein